MNEKNRLKDKQALLDELNLKKDELKQQVASGMTKEKKERVAVGVEVEHVLFFSPCDLQLPR